MENKLNFERYQRQILLNEFGEVAQHKLLNSKVLVCGAGGLGSPALLYLAAAGVGTLGIADFDNVELSNLQRQILYSTNDIGKPKVAIATQKLNELNPEINIITHKDFLNNKNAIEIISQYDLVIDGTDNFETRYMINDLCVILKKTLIYGSILRFEGQIGVFNYKKNEDEITTNYRDLYPNPPDPRNAISCNESGVIGVLPGIIGTMQANEAIKIITETGTPLTNQILTYNSLYNTFYTVNILPNKSDKSVIPHSIEEFMNFDYKWFCSSKNVSHEINIDEFKKILESEKLTIIDVREEYETPETNDFEYLKVPMSNIYEFVNTFNSKNKIVVFCQTGIRSISITKILKEELPENDIYSLKGGIVAWEKFK